KLFDEFKDSDNVAHFHDSCWAMCYGPDAHPDLRSLADRAVKRLTKDPANYNYVNTAACLLYRAGRDDEALQWLHASMQANPSGDGYAYDWVFLAMAQQRKGHPEEARKWLDKTKTWLASEGKSRAATNPIFRITLELMIREAEAALSDRKAPHSSKNQ